MSLARNDQKYPVLTPSIDSTLLLTLLPFVLSVIAGSIDVTTFLGLGGLFSAHITGNLVLLAAHIVIGGLISIAQIISVPVFFIALALARLIVSVLERKDKAPLLPLLLLQLILLVSCLCISIIAMHHHADTNAASLILAGMLAVCAMAVQNALVQTALKDSPPTAVMTTNITRFTLDVGEVLLGNKPARIETARHRARRTWPAIVGFIVGCALGASSEAQVGLWALLWPVGLAALTLIMAGCAILTTCRK